jgi:hypothetical protein
MAGGVANATNLAGDLPSAERRVHGDVDRHPGRRVDVDGKPILVAAEEALPERRQRKHPAAGEEHGRHLERALERVLRGGGHHRGAPEQLLVRHAVHEPRWGHELRKVRVRVGAAADSAPADVHTVVLGNVKLVTLLS